MLGASPAFVPVERIRVLYFTGAALLERANDRFGPDRLLGRSVHFDAIAGFKHQRFATRRGGPQSLLGTRTSVALPRLDVRRVVADADAKQVRHEG
jgi:hypothetical protein